MELILWYAINVIQLLPLLKFFIALMVSYFQKTRLHKLKTSLFLKPYLTHMVFCHFLKSFVSIFNISNFYFFAYTYLNFYFIFFILSSTIKKDRDNSLSFYFIGIFTAYSSSLGSFTKPGPAKKCMIVSPVISKLLSFIHFRSFSTYSFLSLNLFLQ